MHVFVAIATEYSRGQSLKPYVMPKTAKQTFSLEAPVNETTGKNTAIILYNNNIYKITPIKMIQCAREKIMIFVQFECMVNEAHSIIVQ